MVHELSGNSRWEAVVLTGIMNGVHPSTVYKAKQRHQRRLVAGGINKLKLHKRGGVSKVVDFDEFALKSLRLLVHRDFFDSGLPVSQRRLHAAMKEAKLDQQCGVSIGATTMMKLLRRIGFKYLKRTDDKSHMYASKSVVRQRLEFIRNVERFKLEGWLFMFQDETWDDALRPPKTRELTDTSVTPEERLRPWSDFKNDKLKVVKDNAPRMMVQCLISHEYGVIAPFVRPVNTGTGKAKSRGKKRRLAQMMDPNEPDPADADQERDEADSAEFADAHRNMSTRLFLLWLEECCKYIRENIRRRTVIILDNAPYHNMKYPPPPTKYTKDMMSAWMREHMSGEAIPTLAKDMAAAIRAYRKKQPYQADIIAARYGVALLRLPPYHSSMNPIEQLWSWWKHDVRMQQGTVKRGKWELQAFMKKVLIEQGTRRLDDIRSNIDRCFGLYEQYKETDGMLLDRMDTVHRLIIKLDASASEESSDDEIPVNINLDGMSSDNEEE